MPVDCVGSPGYSYTVAGRHQRIIKPAVGIRVYIAPFWPKIYFEKLYAFLNVNYDRVRMVDAWDFKR